MEPEKKSPRPRRTKKIIQKESEARELKHKLAYIILIISIIYCIVDQDIKHTTDKVIAEKRNIENNLVQNNVMSPKLKPTDKKFVGTLESYDTSCFSDGVCSIVVSGVKVIETIGGRQMQGKELGRLIGVKSIRDFKDHIGKKFEIYAEPQPNGDYSLYGNKSYYIRLLNY